MALRLEIVLEDNGQLRLEAPPDKLHALGLCELAKHALLAKPSEQSRIAVVPDLAGLNNRKAG